MSHRSIGLLLQIVAVFSVAASVFVLGAVVIALLRSTPQIGNLKLNLGDGLLPFTLWFLGSELRRGSEGARKVTLAAMVYLAAAGVLGLVFLLTTRILDDVPETWKLAAYGLVVLTIVLPALCIYGLRKRN